MRFEIKHNIKEVVEQTMNQQDSLKKETVIEMYRAMTILEAAIKQNIRVRSGLKVRSGSLLNSIQKHVTQQDGTVTGKIGPENIPYAAIHEEGGTIPSRRVEPRHTKALRWMGTNGGFWFSKGHTIPSFNIKARPYLAPAWEEKAQVIRDNFGLMLQKILEKNT